MEKKKDKVKKGSTKEKKGKGRKGGEGEEKKRMGEKRKTENEKWLKNTVIVKSNVLQSSPNKQKDIIEKGE